VETPTAAPDSTGTAQPGSTPTEAPTTIQEGATVYITENDVRLRGGPTTEEDNIVTGLFQGQVMIVTGPAEQGSGITWWPVQDANDPSLVGYVAEDFLSLEPIEPAA
jgi:hypothetical protein